MQRKQKEEFLTDFFGIVLTPQKRGQWFWEIKQLLPCDSDTVMSGYGKNKKEAVEQCTTALDVLMYEVIGSFHRIYNFLDDQK